MGDSGEFRNYNLKFHLDTGLATVKIQGTNYGKGKRNTLDWASYSLSSSSDPVFNQLCDFRPATSSFPDRSLITCTMRAKEVDVSRVSKTAKVI